MRVNEWACGFRCPTRVVKLGLCGYIVGDLECGNTRNQVYALPKLRRLPLMDFVFATLSCERVLVFAQSWCVFLSVQELYKHTNTTSTRCGRAGLCIINRKGERETKREKEREKERRRAKEREGGRVMEFVVEPQQQERACE